MKTIKIAFVNIESNRPTIPVAFACGVGDVEKTDFINIKRYDKLREVAKNKLAVVAPDEADLLVYPHKLKRNDSFPGLNNYAKEHNKVCLFFRDDDDYLPVKVGFGKVFKTSMFNKIRKINEYAMPAMADDLLRNANGKIKILQKGNVPSVGFCGYVGNGKYEYFYLLQCRIQKFKGLNVRNKVLNELESSKELESQIIKRKKFRAGAIRMDDKYVKSIKQEFFDNVNQSDYSLALRGMGNFSHRFYEILCCGKIPLFVNTDCVMPFEKEIKWSTHCIWVEECDIRCIGEIVKSFHSSISGADFVELQHRNRLLWEDWLSPDGFYLKLFEKQLAEMKMITRN